MDNLIRKGKSYNIIFGISVFLLAILFIYLPLRDDIHSTLLSNWVITSRSSTFAMQVFIDRCHEGARGISSRSVIRDAIAQYKAGELSWDELADFTQPKFNDGVKVLDNLVLAFRLVDDKVLVAYAGSEEHPVTEIPQFLVEGADNSAIALLHGRYHLVVPSDVVLNGEILGRDVLVYDLSSLLLELNTNELNVDIVDQANFLNLSQGNLIASGEDYQVYRQGARIDYLQQLDPGKYYLHIATSYDTIVGQSQKRMNTQLILFIIGVILVFFVLNMLTVRHANRILQDTESSRDTFRKYAYQDTLTSAYSRLSLEHWLEAQKRGYPGTSYTLVMMDVDFFKEINDSHGHDVGDEVLKTLSSVLLRVIRKDDLVIRYGGDEFLVIFKSASMAVVEDIISRILQQLSSEHSFEFAIEVSYGIAEMGDIFEFDQALKLADERMYAYKRAKNSQR